MWGRDNRTIAQVFAMKVAECHDCCVVSSVPLSATTAVPPTQDSVDLRDFDEVIRPDRMESRRRCI